MDLGENQSHVSWHMLFAWRVRSSWTLLFHQFADIVM